jgi:hypothetical protein
MCIYSENTLINILLENHLTRNVEVYMKALGNFVKVIFTGVRVGAHFGKFFDILKTVEFSTPKHYMFFLVSRRIRWYVGHDHTG